MFCFSARALRHEADVTMVMRNRLQGQRIIVLPWPQASRESYCWPYSAPTYHTVLYTSWSCRRSCRPLTNPTRDILVDTYLVNVPLGAYLITLPALIFLNNLSPTNPHYRGLQCYHIVFAGLCEQLVTSLPSLQVPQCYLTPWSFRTTCHPPNPTTGAYSATTQ